MPSRARTTRNLAGAALLTALVVLAVSFIQGPPESVPAVALDWPLILYLERAALAAGVIMGIGGTADRMLRGDPVQGFSAPGGPGVQLVEQVAEVDEALRDVVDEGFKELDERISALEQKSSAGPGGGTMERE
jgi:hypothetical protein